MTVVLGQPLRCADVVAVARGEGVRIGPAAREAIEDGLARHEALGGPDAIAHVEGWLVGQQSRAPAPDRVRAFIRGHCAGVGPLLPASQVRALVLCRAAVLARALSGVRPAAVQRLVDLLEAGIHPCVPSQGSVGAAGDLAPLAHVVEVAAGYGGQADTPGGRLPGPEAVAPLGPFEPTPKEALALINGSTLSVALAALACHRARRLLDTAEVALAMTMEVVRASSGLVDAALLAARGHPGGEAVGQRLRALLEGSRLVHGGRRPDAFSIRCAPAVLGAAREALDYAEQVVERELNGACDNPLVLPEGRVEGGHFHGAPVALVMDHLKAALTQVASASERRIFRLTYGQLTDHLPSFLVESTGLNSGFMLAQYTAASLVSECKGLSHPAVVDSVPTGQHHEDHVSMAPIAARTALQVVEAVAEVLAIEVLVAAQGLDLRVEGVRYDADGRRLPPRPASLAPRVAAVLTRVRREVPRWREDRVLHLDQRRVAALVRSGAIVRAAGLGGGEVDHRW